MPGVIEEPITVSVFCVGCREYKRLTVDRKHWYTFYNNPNRPHVQDLFVDRTGMSYLSADQRELLISSTCGPCFDALFPPEDDEAGVKGNK